MRLRQHARRLIASTKSKSKESPSPNPQKTVISPERERTISPINNMKEFTWNNSTSPKKNNKFNDDPAIEEKSRNSPSRRTESNKLTLQSFNAILDKLSPKTEVKVSVILF
jgi:hypothetical protein